MQDLCTIYKILLLCSKIPEIPTSVQLDNEPTQDDTEELQHNPAKIFSAKFQQLKLRGYHPSGEYIYIVRPVLIEPFTCRWRNQQLCSWLASLLVSPQFLSSRALHLFLQTSHSVPRILENIEGKRDDQVIQSFALF